MNIEDFRWPEDPEEIPTEWLWGRIRLWRNTELTSTDFTQLPDVNIDKQAWAKYRQGLRDITDFDTPEDIAWPERPAQTIVTDDGGVIAEIITIPSGNNEDAPSTEIIDDTLDESTVTE